MSSDPVILTIPREIHEPLEAACFFLPDDADEVRIDMSAVRWIAPVGVVALLAQSLRRREQGASLQVTLPRNQEVRSYLKAIGFYQALRDQGTPVDEEGFDLDTGYTARPRLSLEKVRNQFEVDQAVSRLTDALGKSKAPADLIMVMEIVVSELVDNAVQHGTHSYVVAQTHTGARSGTPGVHVAAADFGPGFQRTLASYSPASETAAIIKAFEMGVTGTQEERGVGLSEAREWIDGYPGARLAIASRTGLVERVDGSFRSTEGQDCGGVFVSMYFPYAGGEWGEASQTLPR